MGRLPTLLRKKESLSRNSQYLLLIAFILGLLFLFWSSQKFFSWLSYEKLSKEDIAAILISGSHQERVSALSQWLMLSRAEDKAIHSTVTQKEILELRNLLEEMSSGNVVDPFALSLIIALMSHGAEFLENQDREKILHLIEKAKASPVDEAWQMVYSEGLNSLALASKLWNDELWMFFQKELQQGQDFFSSAAAFSLGLALSQDENGYSYKDTIREALAARLEYSQGLLTYNIAFSLSRVADDRAKGVLLKLLRECRSIGASDKNFGVKKFQLCSQSFASAAKYNDLTLRNTLLDISQSHPHLKLRQAARIFVEKLPPPGQ